MQHERHGYARSAEFHELFMDEAWRAMRPHVEAALAGIGAHGVVIELGAGSGLGTRVVAAATEARIVAVEPDPVMRAMLVARIADDEALSRRVTIVADAVPECLSTLPTRVEAVVCAHTLGHLEPEERAALYAWLAAHLAEGGTALATVQRERADASPPPPSERTIGAQRYVERHERAASGTWRTVYEVREGDRLVRGLVAEGDWRSVGADEVVAAGARGGLHATLLADGVVLLARSRA